MVATAVAEAAVAEVGDELDVWLLPTLQYTKSNEHAWSPGTVWLSATTLLAVLDDIGRCVATTPARRLVFLNGHGGNSSLLSVANRELRLNHGLMTFLAHPGMPADQGGTSPASELGMGVHGGTDETSLMLHLAPDLCDMSKAARRARHLAANTLRALRRAGVSFGWLSERLRPRRPHRRPDGGHRRAGRRAVRRLRDAFCEALARDLRVRLRPLNVDVPSTGTLRGRRRAAVAAARGARRDRRGHGPERRAGCARLALTDADRHGRDLVVAWMADLGLDVSIDAIGNVVATRAGHATRPRRR